MRNPRHQGLVLTLLAVVTVTFFGAVFGMALGFMLDDGNGREPDPGTEAVQAPAEPEPATPPPATPGEEPANTVAGEQASVSLVATTVNRELNGVEVLLELENRGDTDIHFVFTPSKDVTVSDADGKPYNLQWAEYAADVRVAPDERVRLVRAFFTGPLSDNAGPLNVELSHVPGLDDATWEVPVP